MTLHKFLSILIGPSGRYLRGLWNPDEILTNLLWSADVKVSRTIATQIINGHRSLPKKYAIPYRGDGGVELLEEDLDAFLTHYHSRAMLHDIYQKMHTAVITATLTSDQISEIERCYISTSPTIGDMAAYFSRILWHIAVH